VAPGGSGVTGRLLASGNGLPGLDRVPIWLNDPQNWWGPEGLLARIREHLVYTAIILVIAIVIALPLGLLIGHTGRGVFLLVGAANGLRAVPTLGLLVLVGPVWLSQKIHIKTTIPGIAGRGDLIYLIPAVIVLVLLALPPILTNTYAGVQNVDPAARDAARGMGMTGWQVVRKVEFPCALPLIMSGIRSATLQVIATVTVAAYVFLGGLGRFIVDGVNELPDLQFGYPAMVSAGIVVAALAVLADGLLGLVQRFVVSPGISGRRTRRRIDVSAVDQQAEAQLANA
jgi:osmoprotectant transport system permease protein